MDTQSESVAALDPYSYWRQAVAARKPVDVPKGIAALGYYRSRDNEAFAFYDDDGRTVVWRSGTQWRAPTHQDEIVELFARLASGPVSYEDFSEFQSTGRWPDQIAPVEVSADLPPHERTAAEIEGQFAALEKWVAEIGAVGNQVQADKAGNFADEFAKFEKRAIAEHKAAKEPFLEGGRAVDATWKPVIARADELKRWAKKLPEAYLIAEKARIRAEEEARRAEAERLQREAAERRRIAEAANAPPPPEPPAPLPFAPPPQKAKAGKVHIREVTKHNIVDMRAVLEHLAKMNSHSAELVAAVQTIVNRLRNAGVEVPGVETTKVEVAA